MRENEEETANLPLSEMLEEIKSMRREAAQTRKSVALLTAQPATNDVLATPRATPALNWGALISQAPAWIGLVAAAIVGYSSLNTRLSTVEYQNQVSITERADLRRRCDKTDETLTGLRSDLSEIKATLKQMAENKHE